MGIIQSIMDAKLRENPKLIWNVLTSPELRSAVSVEPNRKWECEGPKITLSV